MDFEELYNNWANLQHPIPPNYVKTGMVAYSIQSPGWEKTFGGFEEFFTHHYWDGLEVKPKGE